MPGDLARALGDLRDPRLWGVAARAAGLSLALLAGLFVMLGWALGVGADLTVSIPLFGDAVLDGDLIGLFGVLVALWLGALLMPMVAAMVVGLMLDQVAEAVEARDYPALPAARPATLAAQLSASLRLLALTAALNLLGLAVATVAPPIAPVAFIVLNGWLIGREYLELVALRRMDGAAARRLRQATRWRAFGLGAGVAVLLLIPLMGLLAPMIGVAAATHLLHRSWSGGGNRRP